ncbi:MAG: UDP-3-O-[3-hydroxymyristoyl] glucosamine N-acyltransferase [Arenicella sp.]|jgi:UDP-3-O-[3-hydroxymyristoyl] glucosamine N-acyltransferase
MFTLEQVENQIDGVQVIGSLQKEVKGIISLGDKDVGTSDLFWCSDKNLSNLDLAQLGTGIISTKAYTGLKIDIDNSSACWLICENPRRLFMQILTLFVAKKIDWGIICKSAIIDESIKLNREQLSIGSHVIIERGSVIGSNVIIGANTVILEDTVIEDNVKIGCNCTIGGVGFGYEPNENKEFELIPHVGNVQIKSGAEIGNNVCIDRAVLGSTLIGQNVKIDNLVHIAHGVVVGANSLIIANAMIAGSVKIGKNVWISPSSSIIQKVNIEDDSMVGMGSVVIKDVEKSTIVAGVPAKKIKSK